MTNTLFPIPLMKRRKRSPLHEAAKVSALETASVQAGFELSRFIDFIRIKTGADETDAAMAAAICLHSLPAYFSENPEALEELRAIVNRNAEA